MEGARPLESLDHKAGVLAHNLVQDALGPPRHLGRRAPREGQKQDPARIGAVDDQMRDAVSERAGLSRARSSNDEERRAQRRMFALTPCSTARRCSGLSLSR